MHFLSIFFLGLLLATSAVEAAVEMPAVSHLKGLQWLGHASLRLERGGMVVYWDPWKIAGQPQDADLILVTHPHFDHCSSEDLAKLATETTTIVTVAECAKSLEAAGLPGKIHVMVPGEIFEVGSARVEAVPAYNTNKEFHLQESAWAGYILELGGDRFYHAGDTDTITEMTSFQDIDVALLPVSGTYTMTAEEAGQAAQMIRPKVAVPIHYGSIIGTDADANRFQAAAGSVIVEILEREGQPE